MGWQENIGKNCLSFARYKLGLDEVETYIDPHEVGVRDLKKNFELTNPEKADAIAILGRVYGQRCVVHMAVRSDSTPTLYEHRPCLSAQPEDVYDFQLIADGRYSYPWIEGIAPEKKVYLKLKNTQS